MGKRVILFLSFLILSYSVKADYITAADLNYTCIGSGRYQFDLVVYAECGGTVDLSTRGDFSVTFYSRKLGVDAFFVVDKPLDKAQGEEVKIFCDSEITNCDAAAGPSAARGLFKFEYTGLPCDR